MGVKRLCWMVCRAINEPFFRNVSIYFQKTLSTRDCDTVEFFPHDTPFPKIKTIDFLQQESTDIVDILKNPPSTKKTSLAAGDPVINALLMKTDMVTNQVHSCGIG